VRKINYFIVLLLFFSCTGNKKEKPSQKPSELNNTELLSFLAESDENELAPYWLEAEKREKIGLRFIAQDKSGAIFKFIRDNSVNDEVANRYILFKLQDVSNLSYAEKSVLFYKAGEYQLREAVPLILKALDGERAIGPHISAATTFKELQSQETKQWLLRNLDENYINTLGTGGFDDASKRKQLTDISRMALDVLKSK
jgi:hypothetical protein